MNLWRYLDRLPVGPHGGMIIIAGIVVAMVLVWVLV